MRDDDDRDVAAGGDPAERRDRAAQALRLVGVDRSVEALRPRVDHDEPQPPLVGGDDLVEPLRLRGQADGGGVVVGLALLVEPPFEREEMHLRQVCAERTQPQLGDVLAVFGHDDQRLAVAVLGELG